MSHKTEKVWTTKAGLLATILIVGGTHRCGYVGVPKGHPLYKVQYGEQTDCITRKMVESTMVGKKGAMILVTASVGSDGDNRVRRSPDILLDVHGGLTYSDSGETDSYPLEDPNPLWWFGFDCNHCEDWPISGPQPWSDPEGVVRMLDYVVSECERLAEQLVELTQKEEETHANNND